MMIQTNGEFRQRVKELTGFPNWEGMEAKEWVVRHNFYFSDEEFYTMQSRLIKKHALYEIALYRGEA